MHPQLLGEFTSRQRLSSEPAACCGLLPWDPPPGFGVSRPALAMDLAAHGAPLDTAALSSALTGLIYGAEQLRLHGQRSANPGLFGESRAASGPQRCSQQLQLSPAVGQH